MVTVKALANKYPPSNGSPMTDSHSITKETHEQWTRIGWLQPTSHATGRQVSITLHILQNPWTVGNTSLQCPYKCLHWTILATTFLRQPTNNFYGWGRRRSEGRRRGWRRRREKEEIMEVRKGKERKSW